MTKATLLNKSFWFLFWSFIIGLSVFFYVTTILDYSYGYIPENFKRGFWDSKIWFICHIVGASAALLLGPLQFWPKFRTRFIRYHRAAGKIFIFGSLLAAVGAFRINLMYDCVACRYSLGILSVIWFFVTAAAWWAIKNKNVKAHRQFMIRSYTASLAFVFIRISSILPFNPYPFIDDRTQQRITSEWLCWVIPFMVIELYMVWLPSLRKRI
ncbi:MAG: DUF2306 domain-containing protein [Chitinophagaceae bacterium]|nr:DUF2306 domain-containing protein [Chitinophagaceae bacterium]